MSTNVAVITFWGYHLLSRHHPPIHLPSQVSLLRSDLCHCAPTLLRTHHLEVIPMIQSVFAEGCRAMDTEEGFWLTDYGKYKG